MQVISRHELSRYFHAAGLNAESRDFPDAPDVDNLPFIHRLTLRECVPPPFVRGPHRKVIFSDGRIEGPFPLADRPALSRFVPALFSHLHVSSVLAVVAEGTFWLNNKGQAEYLARVPDARHVTRFLRKRGLTDRFQGGFRIQPNGFDHILPQLAINTFAGGGDVLFASLDAACPLTILACHHFDLHLASPQAGRIEIATMLADVCGLATDAFRLPELPDLPAGLGLWPNADTPFATGWGESPALAARGR